MRALLACALAAFTRVSLLIEAMDLEPVSAPDESL